MRIAFLLAMITACSSPTHLASSGLSGAAGPCYSPSDYGGLPTSPSSPTPIDSRPAFQLALDAAADAGGGEVCVPRGRWNVSRAPLGSYNAHAALSTHAALVSIVGVGPESVIAGYGDQGGGDTHLISLDPGARGITIADLTLDTGQMTDTSEQTHAIEIGSAVCSGVTCNQEVLDVRVRSVHFVHPDAVAGRKGDCVRILGNTPATAVERVSIVDSTFGICARSGIGVQRNVHGLIIADNQFAPNAWDQAIDFEPTGDPTRDSNDTTVISGNVFHDDRTLAQGDFAVSLGGVGPAGRIVLTGNVFEGRGVTLYRVADTTIADNTFNAVMTSPSGVINVQNVSPRLVIHHNTIHRTGVAGPLIRVTPHSGGFPSDVIVDHNAGLQDTTYHALYFEATGSLVVDHNQIRFGSPAPGMAAIYERATSAAVDNVLIDGNQIAGTIGQAVFLAASPYPIGAVTVSGNVAQGAAAGLVCTGPGGFAPAVISYGNRIGARQCAVVVGGD